VLIDISSIHHSNGRIFKVYRQGDLIQRLIQTSCSKREKNTKHLIIKQV
jgi:hypothetical protein